jgi:hypothetical protein
MPSKRQLLRKQRRWAESVGIHVDNRGYLDSVEVNLYAPLSAPARAAFEHGSGSELRSRGTAPPKLRALHSSAALCVNVFDYWSERPAEGAPLLRALSLSSPLERLRFEAQFDTGLPGNPPNLDVALELRSGTVAAIESKFTEWLGSKQRKATPFKDKYFEHHAERWTARGLPGCQILASEMQNGTTTFRVLDAAQLLKHALGLATQLGGECSLRYVYFDVDCPSRSEHRKEIEHLKERVDPGLGFLATSYQELIGRIAADPDADRGHVKYLQTRYLE